MRVPTNNNRIQILAAGTIATFAMAMSASAIARPIDDPALPHGVEYSSTQGTTPSSEPVLRRDGSKAVPFVANLDQSAPATASSFAWGDAGIGAGAAFALTMIGIGGLLVLSNRRHRHGGSATTA